MALLSSPLQVPVLLFLAVTFTGNVFHVRAYPTGAGTKACPAESPQVCHKGSPQMSASPYSLEVKDVTYSPGNTVNVTIQMTNGNTSFMGFLVGAHRLAGDTKEYLGSFVSTPESQPQCMANGNSGVTHTNNKEKQSVVLLWSPPSSNVGSIVFTAAVVQDFSTYWVNVSSGVLTPRDYPPANQTTTTPPPSTNQFAKDPGCGKTKACYGNCQDGVCTFQATWYKADQSLVVSLKSAVNSADNVWAALGFGTKPKMNPASVTQCVAYKGEVQAFTSYNKDYNNKRVKPNDKIGLSNVTGSVKDGVFACTFRRQLIVKGGGLEVYNLTKSFHILMARGLANGWTIQPHEEADAFVTGDSYDVTSDVDIGAHASSMTLVKLHGCLMTFAWLFSASIGVLVARFLKPVWANQTLCGVKMWFAIHRLTMVVAFLATATGFVIIFIHIGGWSQITKPEYKTVHPILGTIVTGLTVLNPLMALFRCDPRHESRPLFNWAHFLMGSSAYILGVVTVGIGVNMPLAEIPEYATFCVVGFGAWHVLAHLMMEVIGCCERSDSMVGAYKNLQRFTYSFYALRYHLFRQVIFTIHVFIAVGVCGAVMCSIIGF